MKEHGTQQPPPLSFEHDQRSIECTKIHKGLEIDIDNITAEKNGKKKEGTIEKNNAVG
jgi:hypothetical protein